MAMSRRCLGKDAWCIIQLLAFDKSEDRDDPMTLLQKTEEYCIGNFNEVFERSQFFLRQRLDKETIDELDTSLETLANSYDLFQCMKDNLIRDNLVIGIQNESTTKKLLSMRQLDLRT